MVNVLKVVFCLVVSICITREAQAQLPVCSGAGSGLIYYITGNKIYNLDPTQPLSATNPAVNTIAPPGSGASGIAVSKNINGPGASPTFYVVSGGNYWYYDGSTWVNTGHSQGSAAAVNPGAGGGFLYSLVGASGEIYKYDGTGNATLLVTISDFLGGGPYDCVADCNGDFYLLKTSTTGVGQYLRKYSSTGTLLQSWTLSGATNSSSGGGMAIVGNRVYYVNSSGYWGGTISGANVSFTKIASTLSPGPSDFSSCAIGGESGGSTQAHANVDTVYVCDTVTATTLYPLDTTTGEVVDWKVIGGSAKLAGTGDTVTMTASSDATILLQIVDTQACGKIRLDTVEVIYVGIELDAGKARTLIGCNVYTDTLHATLKNEKQGIAYTIKWTPAGNIVAMGDTLTPVIKQHAPTVYTIKVTTMAENGGCVWTDTVSRGAKFQVSAAMTIADTIICTGDTAIVDGTKSIILTGGGNAQYAWDFGDGDTGDGKQAMHTYSAPGHYEVKLLLMDNTGCMDSAAGNIDIYLPPFIDLGMDTSICDGVSMELPVHNNTGENIVSYKWSDSSTSPTLKIYGEGMYVLQVSNECGSFTDSIDVGRKDCSVWFPSGFTPNGDGLNDLARVRGKHLPDLADFQIMIVNRFGERVFESRDYTQGWDGTYKGQPAEMSTYYYLIQYRITGNQQKELMKGDLTLLR